jgi:hypothetical protein
MDLKFLFSGFTAKKKDYVHALTKIIGSLDGITGSYEKYELSAQAKDNEKAESHIKNIEWQIDKFPFSTFQFLEKSFYLKRSSRFRSVETETKKVLSSFKKKISEVKKKGMPQEKLHEIDLVIEVKSQIDRLIKSVESFYSKVNVAFQSIYLFPLLAAYFLGVYHRLEMGFEVVSKKIMWPNLAYEAPTSDKDYFKFSKSYADKYWLEFSKYYFDRENNFEKLYARNEDLRQYLSDKNPKKELEDAIKQNDIYGYEDKPDGSRRYFKKVKFSENNSLVAKLVVQNDSETKPVLVHDITVRLNLTDDRPFPWENLVVTANIEAGITKPNDKQKNRVDRYLTREIENIDAEKIVYLRDSGIGPVTDLTWTVTANNLKLFEGDRNMLYHETQYVSVNTAPPDYSFVSPLDDGFLKNSLFLKGSSPTGSESANKKKEKYFKFLDGWYEIIYTSERMCQITECTKADGLNIDYSFFSLREEKSDKRFTVSLSKPRIYYQLREDLELNDPRKIIGETRSFIDISELSLQSSALDILFSFLTAVIGEPSYIYKAKGEDLFSQNVYLDLLYGRSAYFNQNLDVILNPSGYLIFNTTVKNLNNGVYMMNLQINNQTVSKVKFEYFKPEKWKFNIGEVDWLREKLGLRKPSEEKLGNRK